jgi:hypothetical protein
MGGIGFRAGTCYYTSEYLSYQIVAHTSFAYASLHVFVFLLVMCSYTASCLFLEVMWYYLYIFVVLLYRFHRAFEPGERNMETSAMM